MDKNEQKGSFEWETGYIAFLINGFCKGRCCVSNCIEIWSMFFHKSKPESNADREVAVFVAVSIYAPQEI